MEVYCANVKALLLFMRLATSKRGSYYMSFILALHYVYHPHLCVYVNVIYRVYYVLIRKLQTLRCNGTEEEVYSVIMVKPKGVWPLRIITIIIIIAKALSFV